MSRTFKNMGTIKAYIFHADSTTQQIYGGAVAILNQNDTYTVTSGTYKVCAKASEITSPVSLYYKTHNGTNYVNPVTDGNEYFTGYIYTYNNITYYRDQLYFGTGLTTNISIAYSAPSHDIATITNSFANTLLTTNPVWIVNAYYQSDYRVNFTLTTTNDYTFNDAVHPVITISITEPDGAGGTYTHDTDITLNSYNSAHTTATTDTITTVSTTKKINSITVKSASIIAPTKQTFNITGSEPYGINCTTTWTPTGTSFDVGTELIFTSVANTGYEFTEAPTVTLYAGALTETHEFTIDASKETATLTLTVNKIEQSNVSSVSITAQATLKKEVPTTTYKFVNIYALTDENLVDLGKVRFYEATGTGLQLVDLAYYVNSLKRFFVPIPVNEEITQNVVLANIDTKVSCKIVSSDFIDLDCGSVTIESTNNNSNDYINTSIKILLPFIGLVNLEADLVMNRTITLTYKISIISGDCIAIIKTNENTIYTFNGNCAENVPYIMNNIMWEMKSSFDVNANVLYGFTPTIIVIYHENYNDNSTILTNDNKYIKLSDATGLNVIDDVIINDASIPNNEQEMILNTLRNGVIFD